MNLPMLPFTILFLIGTQGNTNNCLNSTTTKLLNRSALKWNKAEDMEHWWRYWIHLFLAAGKHNYVSMSMKFLWILRKLNPDIKAIYQQYRVFSFSGKEGTGIPADGVNELVYNRFADNHILTHILS